MKLTVATSWAAKTYTTMSGAMRITPSVIDWNISANERKWPDIAP